MNSFLNILSKISHISFGKSTIDFKTCACSLYVNFLNVSKVGCLLKFCNLIVKIRSSSVNFLFCKISLYFTNSG